MVDTLALGASAVRRGSSSLLSRTKEKRHIMCLFSLVFTREKIRTSLLRSKRKCGETKKARRSSLRALSQWRSELLRAMYSLTHLISPLSKIQAQRDKD